jgi:hypothetical protein
MSIPVTTIEDARDEQALTRVELDDSGETVAFSFLGSSLGDAVSIVGEQGGVQRVLTVDTDAVVDVALSGDGQWLHAVNKPYGFATVHSSFFERVDDGSGRVKAHSQAFGEEGIQGGVLNDDGTRLVASINVGASIGGTGGLWSMVRGQMGLPGHPEVSYVGTRFDEDDNLVVRVEAEASDAITAVYVLPLYDRYVDPVVVFTGSEDNPLYFMRFGANLPELEDMPGTYEGTFTVDRSLLDEHFTLRAVVVSGPDGSGGNKAAFADVRIE